MDQGRAGRRTGGHGGRGATTAVTPRHETSPAVTDQPSPTIPKLCPAHQQAPQRPCKGKASCQHAATTPTPPPRARIHQSRNHHQQAVSKGNTQRQGAYPKKNSGKRETEKLPTQICKAIKVHQIQLQKKKKRWNPAQKKRLLHYGRGGSGGATHLWFKRWQAPFMSKGARADGTQPFFAQRLVIESASSKRRSKTESSSSYESVARSRPRSSGGRQQCQSMDCTRFLQKHI